MADLLTPEELKDIEKKAESLDGIVACMQSATYTAAYLASKAQSHKTVSQIIEIVGDWSTLTPIEIRIKYSDAYILPDVRMSLVDYLTKHFGVE